MCFPFLSKRHWPASKFPETLFEHFVETKFYNEEREYPNLYLRQDFLNTLKTNDEFSKFWTHIQEQHPSKKDYFLSLTNEEEPYHSGWIDYQYSLYRKQNAFDALSEDERRSLQSDFEELRPAAYQAALEGESRRLNYEISDVRPICLVLPCKPNHEEESMLARLPDEIFGKILPKLDTLDIFRMTLVCRHWKYMIHSNSRHLKKAEHSVTTHLITFTKWMDPKKTPCSYLFWCQYQTFSWCLAKWCCGISENFETLILDHLVSYAHLTTLLQSCPNLKHLRIGYDVDHYISPNFASPARVQLRKLEVFMSHCVNDMYGCNKHSGQLHSDLLISSQSLRVFKSALNSRHLLAMMSRYSWSHVFSKLIALDLEDFTLSILQMLAQIDNMQLKYLSLGCHSEYHEREQCFDDIRSINALNQLLPRLSKLEMLRTSLFIGVNDKTIQLMTELKLNISWAVLYPFQYPRYFEDGEGYPLYVNDLQPEVLDDFRNMLLVKNPEIDLSQIHVVLQEGKTLELLEAMDTGLTILETNCNGYIPTPVNELYDPKIKQRLGIDY